MSARSVAALCLTACMSAGALTVAAAPVASAEIEGLVSTLPASVVSTQDVSIPFTLSSPTGVCNVTSWGANTQVVKQAEGQYLLTVGQGSLNVGENTVEVNVDSCQDSYQGLSMTVTVPFKMSAGKIVAPWAQDASLRKAHIQVQAGKDSGPVDVTVIRNGAVVHAFPAVAGNKELTYAIKKSQVGGSWAVRASSNGQSSETPLVVADRWVPIGGQDPLHFPRCSTVTWAYETKGQPKGVNNMKKDVEASLKQIGAVTGLRFQETSADPDLRLYWDNLGKGGPSGLGGYSFSSHGDTQRYVGTVQLNRQDSWVKQPGFSRSSWGLPGRGVLLLHEIGHAIGLGHVNDQGTIMNPLISPKSPTGYTSGDRAGLRYLYEPQTCPAA